jgi:hypothetical protein
VRRVRRAARAGGAGESGLARLLGLHTLHAAGDALITVALAGTLFFSVPIGEARGRVALYLALTLLPFAFLVPVAGPLLDRFRHGRRNVLALATGGRGLLTWVMAGQIAGLGLYPLALGVLVLSRAYFVARSAALPRVLPPGLGLVSAGARVNIAGTVGTATGGAVGAGLAFLLGPSWVLYLASVVLIVAGVLALKLPDRVDERRAAAEPDDAGSGRLRDAPPALLGPLAGSAALRALQGLLTLFLAFLLRAEQASKVELGIVLGGAALGQLLGTVGAARIPGLPPRRLPLLAPALAGIACLAAALHPATPLIALAAGVAGLAGSIAKFGLDATIQATVAPRRVSSTFARTETILQLTWVVGAGIALLLPTRGALGFAVGAVLMLGGLVAALRLGRPQTRPAPA